ncbi:MAG: hypothetical protein JOZ54_12205 [Acidobacteria bacterium]|nr:hypothetical protein [Acidobacteriota bacterium]
MTEIRPFPTAEAVVIEAMDEVRELPLTGPSCPRPVHLGPVRLGPAVVLHPDDGDGSADVENPQPG